MFDLIIELMVIINAVLLCILIGIHVVDKGRD